MVIREANKNDDFKKLAEYFYYTDPYIFPYMFESVEECKSVLGKLISAESGAFSYKNCVVAEENGQTIGVILYFTSKTNFNYDYSQISLISVRYSYTIEKYISKLQSYVDNGTYIAMLFVEEEFRKHHVATNLLKYIFEISESDKFKLHVLKDNIPALKTYMKLDFKINIQCRGFNGKHMKKPLVYEMTRMV